MKAPSWLATFQSQWGEVLRTPLQRDSGTFTSQPTELWDQLPPAEGQRSRRGLEIYHRQYWLRLFSCLQKEFPLTAGLMGYWNFNGLAQLYLAQHPPRNFALQTLADEFESFLTSRDLPGPSGCLGQAAAWDRARSQCFYAPWVEIWNLDEGLDAEGLERVTFKASGDWRLVAEDWDLLSLFLNSCTQGQAREGSLSWPQRRSETQHFLVQRQPAGLIYRPLPREQAKLYEALQRQSLAAALDELARLCGMGDPDLAQKVEIWMRESLIWGLWQKPARHFKH